MSLLAPQLQAITEGRAAAAKLYSTIDNIPTIDSSSPDGLAPDHCEGDIEFSDVFFNYPSRPDVTVLNGINLRFPATKSAALVGASGCGKSTIVSLLERFYDPTKGSVTVDGNEVKSLNIKWLRSQMGLVSQEPVLFATTIAENVAYGLVNTKYEHVAPEAKMDLVKQACVIANAHEFICDLPEGYSTEVGERGFLLSGGQKRKRLLQSNCLA